MSAPLVAHVIYALSTGGLENGLVNIINRFPPERYRHVIICITTADEFSGRITLPDVQIIQMRKRAGHDLDFYRRLRRLFKRLHPDIIHSRNLAALETQLCSLGMSGVKRVHGEHGREVGDLDGGNWKYLLLRRFMRLFIHHYFTVSKDLKGWLMRRVGVRPDRVTQIYNGVDHDRFKPRNVKPMALLPAHWREHDDIVIVGTVGRLTPVKDQRSLLQAAARLRSKNPAMGSRLRVIVVGEGPLRQELEELAARLAIDTIVWFAGARQDVHELVQLMDLFVLPSLGEGISNTVLEAMASGVPVVATAVGGNLELVENGVTGSLVPVGNERALCDALIENLHDPGELARRGSNAHRFVRSKFDWQRTVTTYVGLYDALLADERASAVKARG